MIRTVARITHYQVQEFLQEGTDLVFKNGMGMGEKLGTAISAGQWKLKTHSCRARVRFTLSDVLF